ncbi:hypothetical protein DL96DRAFT_873793 [Flagelloscypha sp. PMI_526]|nr:hypothetical protein DL96DRAFT_873793 [Flagelloscypha sp. PMI_526]
MHFPFSVLSVSAALAFTLVQCAPRVREIAVFHAYTGSNFTGNELTDNWPSLPTDCSPLGDEDFERKVSSVVVLNGIACTFYDDLDCAGTGLSTRVVETSVDWTGTLYDDVFVRYKCDFTKVGN